MIRVLDDLIRLYGRPARVRVDNGPELTAEAFVEWCTAHRIAIGYIQPGKPDQNAFIERFNRSYREEVLDAHLHQPTVGAQAGIHWAQLVAFASVNVPDIADDRFEWKRTKRAIALGGRVPRGVART